MLLPFLGACSTSSHDLEEKVMGSLQQLAAEETHYSVKHDFLLKYDLDHNGSVVPLITYSRGYQVGDALLFVGGAQGNTSNYLLRFDPDATSEDNTLLWGRRINIPRKADRDKVVFAPKNGNSVYVSDGNNLEEINVRDGKTIRTLTSFGLPLTIEDGIAYFVNASTLQKKALDGSEKGTVTLKDFPGEMGIDRLVVANGNYYFTLGNGFTQRVVVYDSSGKIKFDSYDSDIKGQGVDFALGNGRFYLYSMKDAIIFQDNEQGIKKLKSFKYEDLFGNDVTAGSTAIYFAEMPDGRILTEGHYRTSVPGTFPTLIYTLNGERLSRKVAPELHPMSTMPFWLRSDGSTFQIRSEGRHNYRVLFQEPKK